MSWQLVNTFNEIGPAGIAELFIDSANGLIKITVNEIGNSAFGAVTDGNYIGIKSGNTNIEYFAYKTSGLQQYKPLTIYTAQFTNL